MQTNDSAHGLDLHPTLPCLGCKATVLRCSPTVHSESPSLFKIFSKFLFYLFYEFVITVFFLSSLYFACISANSCFKSPEIPSLSKISESLRSSSVMTNYFVPWRGFEPLCFRRCFWNIRIYQFHHQGNTKIQFFLIFSNYARLNNIIM